MMLLPYFVFLEGSAPTFWGSEDAAIIHSKETASKFVGRRVYFGMVSKYAIAEVNEPTIEKLP